jgi:transposase InsO family protein
MADLPRDRVEPAPPFTYVGVDAFGPWSVVARRTRGGQASSKRWAILFTCLTIRAIHIEVVPEMSSSAFTNALRRFISRFGNVKLFRSDRGTNFVGSVNEIKMDTVNVEEGEIHSWLKDKNVTWIFNPPHASHMGGVWERMIGTVKRILSSMLCDISDKNLTHDVLITLMAEVCAIVNARPIVPVSTDSSVPELLSPSAILTQKLDFTTEEFEHLTLKDIYKSEWRRVQVLANQFWRRWRSEYLQQLQTRSKWRREQANLNEGDVVLVKDSNVPRNRWPYGVVEKILPSDDGKVRKSCIRMYNDGKLTVLTRPISELVLLVESG